MFNRKNIFSSFIKKITVSIFQSSLLQKKPIIKGMASKQVKYLHTARLITLLTGNRNLWKNSWAAVPRLFSSEKSAEQQQQQQSQQQSENSPADPGTVGNNPADQIKKLAQDLEVLGKEVESLKEQNIQLLDKYRRSLAESENLRSRLSKQIADAKLFGIQGFCKELLDVADILGHATNSVPQEELTDKNPHLKSLYEGLSMTQASLFQVFKRHGLETMNPLKEKFDPNLHEALFQKEDSSVDPNTIIEVTKLGYKLHNRVIRPALVGVSK
uniref:GrpE protein homolog n=2 Tax=Glossina TaxID=44049 RepID=A0A1A9ZPJ1_GLOPL